MCVMRPCCWPLFPSRTLFVSENLELGIELSQMGSLVSLLVRACACPIASYCSYYGFGLLPPWRIISELEQTPNPMAMAKSENEKDGVQNCNHVLINIATHLHLTKIIIICLDVLLFSKRGNIHCGIIRDYLLGKRINNHFVHM